MTSNTPPAIPERKDVDPAFKWHLDDIYPSDEAWEKAFSTLKKSVPRIASYKGKLGTAASVLREALEFQDEVSIQLEQAFAYASLNKDVDTRVTAYQDRYNRIYALVVEFSTASSYMEPEILAIPDETIQSFLEEDEGLHLYRHALENLLRRRIHFLSGPEEALIARAGNVFRAPSDAFNMLTDTDLTFPRIKDEEGRTVEISNALYYKYRSSRNRDVRRANEEAFHGTFRKFRNTLASLLRSSVYKALFDAEVRGYESTLHAALDGYTYFRVEWQRDQVRLWFDLRVFQFEF